MGNNFYFERLCVDPLMQAVAESSLNIFKIFFKPKHSWEKYEGEILI